MQEEDQDLVREKLADYLEDAHALEASVVDNLDTMIGTIDHAKLKEVLQRNRQVSRQHLERLKQRLEQLDRGTPVRKRIEGMALALMKGVSDVLRTDEPGKVGRDAYLLAHTQVAAYELLSRLADNAGDAQTATLAREHLEEEKRCADEVAQQWDAFFDLTLAGWRGKQSEKAPTTV
jgi:ferritin-like metal-binding protein YciE